MEKLVLVLTVMVLLVVGWGIIVCEEEEGFEMEGLYE